MVGFLGALAAPALRPGSPWRWLAPILPLALFAYFCRFIPDVVGLAALRYSYAWIPGLDVALDFRLDGLSLIFALIITGIGALILLYSLSYLQGHPRLGNFLGLMLGFMGSMLGLVLSSNLLGLYVFWELTSVFSYFLIGFENREEKARKSAWQALLVTAAGGLALLAGFLLLGRMGGTFDLNALLGRGEELRAHGLYPAATALIVLGAMTKSALFPFHFWLPRAMEAPTPVSAYLHSATMVKAGVYLLARMHPALGDTELWRDGLLAVGAATMLVSAWLALSQTRLKALLAYGTLWALGTLTALLGLGSTHAAEVMAVLLVAHSLYKACLFMTAGILTHETGEKDAERLGGLRRTMPWTCAAAFAGALSMAGLPPSIGFIGKELLLALDPGAGLYRALLLFVALVSAMPILYVAAMVAFKPFFARGQEPRSEIHEARPLFLLGPLLLGVAGVGFGMVSWPLSREMLSPAVSSVLGREEWVELSLWHGFNLSLFLSLVTFAGGLALYRTRARVRGLLAAKPLLALARAGPEALAEGLGRAALGLAHWQTRALQSGYLRIYLALTAAAAAGALIAGSWPDLALPTLSLPRLRWHEVALFLFMLAAAVAAVTASARMLSISALGSVGFAVVLFFALSGAPDLAITQFLVEIATLLILLLAFHRLPWIRDRSRLRTRALSAALALGTGACVAYAAQAALRIEPSRLHPEYFGARSLAEGHGRNVVNVILVDFRAFDTLGEITVLAVAALAVILLMRKGREPRALSVGDRRPASPVFRAAVRFLKPLLLLFSVFLLATGHDYPGGGFAGGLMAASAYILFAMAEGIPAARRVLPLEPRVWIGTGLGLALAAGLAAAAAGKPFLSALWAGPLGTPLLFDAGVFLLVAGVTLAIFLEFGRA